MAHNKGNETRVSDARGLLTERSESEGGYGEKREEGAQVKCCTQG